MKRVEQEQKEREGLFRHIIEKTSDSCKDDNDTFFYREVLINLAPYLFPGQNEMQAVTTMIQALNKARKRGPVNGGVRLNGDAIGGACPKRDLRQDTEER